jgi:tetratricopeptide (TPR) repeat protein
MWTIPKPLLKAYIYDYLDEIEMARTSYENAVEILEKEVADIPNDSRYHSALGIAYAGQGRKEEAINEGLKAADLLPISKDAIYGIAVIQDLAIIYTMIGEFDLALDQLDLLLSRPSWITPAFLDWDIRFEPLKTLPAYKKLMAKHTIAK